MTLEQEIVSVALKQLVVSTDFKKPRMEKIKEYEDVYNGKQKPKLRIQFNVPLPVLSGMVDSLKSDFDEDINLRFAENHPADYLKIKKLQAAWEKESHSLRPEARWDLKVRWDKFLAIMSGRGVQKTFAESDPKFKLHFDTVDYKYFHCEPKGGGLLENHLFAGEEGIFKTQEQLEEGARSGLYSKDAVSRVVNSGAYEQHKREIDLMYGEKLNRFEALGFSPETNNYVGQTVYNLCEWFLTYKGKRYYLLFDPFTTQAIRLKPLKEVFESGLWPYTSWATHEDPKVFWSKAYTDDFFPVHDSVGTMLNQELTNRQKRNLGARAYDKDMFTDVAKLDAAQYRPDALVPVDTKGGTRRISEGIYHFETPELQGTINLTEWLLKATATHTGVEDLNNQADLKGTAQVRYTQLQSAAKRISHKAKSFQEAYAEVGLRVQHGFLENLSESMAIKLTGVEGYGWDYLNRSDLKTTESVDCKIVSIAEEDKENIFGKDQKIKAIDRISANPLLLQKINTDWMIENILRDIGGWKDDEISLAMDVQNFSSRDIMSKADMAILQLVKGKTPDIVYDANTAFMERLIKFEMDHRNQLKEKSNLFYDYLEKHYTIVAENMARIAGQIRTQQSMTPMEGGAPTSTATAPVAPQVQMTNMQTGGGL